MHVNYVAAASPLVQVINILGDDCHGAGKFLFEPCQCEMRRVGLRLLDFRPAHVVKFKYQRRIPLKPCRARHVFNLVPFPEAS